MRAFTPRDQKAVKAAAQTFRQNPEFDTEEAITQLGVGEALVSVLDPKGVPTMVERTLIRPPSSQMGPIDDDERKKLVKNSPVYGLYDEGIDRESAYELLEKRADKRAKQEAAEQEAKEREKAEKAKSKSSRSSGYQRQSTTERFFKNLASSVGRQLGSALVRGLLGSLLRR